MRPRLLRWHSSRSTKSTYLLWLAMGAQSTSGMATRSNVPAFWQLFQQFSGSLPSFIRIIITHPVKLFSDEAIHKVIHKHMTLYLLRRRSISYVCICKVAYDELLINSMMDFLNMQVLSCLTDGVNNILEDNPTYDPTINFSNATTNLFSSAIKTGLCSPCILFNSIPILPLPSATRAQINNMMKENN